MFWESGQKKTKLACFGLVVLFMILKMALSIPVGLGERHEPLGGLGKEAVMNLYVICGAVISIFKKSAICRPHLVNSIASVYEYVGVPSLCAVGCIFLGYACIHTMSCCSPHV